MSIYIGPDGRRQVDPGHLDDRQRQALARLARRRTPGTKPTEVKPCGCTAEQLCPQHIDALPRRERAAPLRAARCAAGDHNRNCPKTCPQKTRSRR